MAPTKFEEHIKGKLDDRTIKPSADAWDKLSKRLDNREEKRSNKPFWWLGIAASIVGLILVAFQFFKSDVEVDNVPKIVVTPELIKYDEIDKIVGDNAENTEGVSEAIKLKDDKQSNQIQKKTTLLKSGFTKETMLIAEEKTIQPTKENADEYVKVVSEKLTFEEQKIQEVIAQVNILKDGENQVTENEIEALLAEAQNEIKLKRLYNESTKKVDALALLQDVEAELDQSFRDKIFKALKENFISVKTAVAQRND